MVGDQGLNSSLELAVPLNVLWPKAGNVLASVDARAITNVSAFIDWGLINNRIGTNCLSGQTTCQVAGAGLALSAAQAGRWTARADLARALISASVTQRGSYRLHLSLSYVFN